MEKKIRAEELQVGDIVHLPLCVVSRGTVVSKEMSPKGNVCVSFKELGMKRKYFATQWLFVQTSSK